MKVIVLPALAAVVCFSFFAAGDRLARHYGKPATSGVQTVTVAPSPACSDMARTWQQIAVAETRVSRLLYAGHRQAADRVAVRVPAQPRGVCS